MAVRRACQVIVPLVCCLAIGAGTALLPTTARWQHKSGVAVLAVARATAALWPSAWGGAWVAFCCGLLKVAYGFCAIFRATWDADARAILQFWVQPVISSLPWSKMIVVGSSIDWIILRQRIHILPLALFSISTGLFGAYPAWHKQCNEQQAEAAGCSYMLFAIQHVALAMVMPAVCFELLPRLLTEISCIRPAASASRQAAAVPATAKPSAQKKPSSADRTSGTQQERHAGGSSTASTISTLTRQPAAATAAQAQLCTGLVLSWRPWHVKEQHSTSQTTAYQYQTAFARRLPVHIKLYGPLQPSDLPRHMTTSLQSALQPMGWCVLQMAARAGCVCLSLDLLQLPAPVQALAGQASNAANGSADGHHPADEDAAGGLSAQASSIIAALLPALDAVMPGSKQEQPASKHDMMFQINHEVIRAHWDTNTSAWQLVTSNTATSARQSTAAEPRLRLGCIQQLFGHRGALHVPSGTSQPVALQSGHPASAPAAPSAASASGSGSPGLKPSSKAPAACVHMLTLQAQLNVPEGCTPPSTSQLAGLVGYEPPPLQAGMQQHEDVKADCLRLLAKCSGSYVSSHVMEVMESSAHQQHPVVKFEVYIPDSFLTRHHMEAAPVGLLSLIVELWQGEEHLASAPVLLQLSDVSRASHAVPNHMVGTSLNTATQPCKCWWWGARGRTMQYAMQELQQLTAAAWHSPELLVSNDWWHDFQHDLIVWLGQVKQAASLCSACAAPMAPGPGLPATQVQPIALQPGEVELLGKDLMSAAHAWGLSHTVKVLQGQMAVIHAWAAQQQQAKRAQLVPQPGEGSDDKVALSGHITWQDVRAAMLGSACEGCEQQCRQQLFRLLAQLQVSSTHLVVSGGLATSGLIRAAILATSGQFYEFALVGSWGLMRMCLFLHQLITAIRTPAVHGHISGSISTPRSQWCLLVLAYAARQVSHVVFVWGLLDVTTKMRPFTILVNYLCVTLAEQAQISLLLPPAAAALLVVCDVAVYMLLSARIGCASAYLLLVLVPMAVLSRLVPEAWIRARLRVGSPAQQQLELNPAANRAVQAASGTATSAWSYEHIKSA